MDTFQLSDLTSVYLLVAGTLVQSLVELLLNTGDTQNSISKR